MEEICGCSRISAGIMDRIPQTRNWIQESFTPSAFGEKIVDHQNVQGKEKSTYQHQNISEVNGKSVCDAEKIKSDQCHDNGCPYKGTAFLFQENSNDRDDDNVAGGDEASFSYCCVLDAKLLEAAGSKKSKSAGNAAQPQVTAVIWRGGYRFF